jgi:hypothetical protein
MTRSYILPALIFILILTACNKGDSPTPPVTKTDLLTSGSWKLTAVVLDDDGDGTYEINSFAIFESCFTDNIWTFKSNGILQMDEGTAKCSSTDPQTNESDWQLTNNDSTIMIHNDSWSVQELNTTTLKWKEMYSGNRSALVTFTRQ